MEGTQPGLIYLESGLSAAATVLNEGDAARERRDSHGDAEPRRKGGKRGKRK